MAVYSSTSDYWIQAGALQFELNALGDPNKVSVSVAAGAVIMAWRQGVIDYNAGHNYRAWALSASPTKLEQSDAAYVYARLSKVGDTAMIIFPYEEIPITGPVSSSSSSSSDEEEEQQYYYIKLGKLSASVVDGQTVNRQWEQAYNTGILDTDQQRREQEDDTLQKMFNLNGNQEIEVLKDMTFLVGTRLLLLRMRALAGGDVSIQNITTASSVTADGYEGTDHSIPTTAAMTGYIQVREALLEQIFNARYLRKDQDDATEYKLTMGSAEVTGGVVIGDDLEVGGDADVENDLSVGRDVGVGRDLSVVRDADVHGDLSVAGGGEFGGKTTHLGGLQVGHYSPGFTGSGANIDTAGNTEVESLTARGFFAAPEYRFNRIAVTEGESLDTNGFGVIEEVDTVNQMIKLKLEDNEWTSIRPGDFCRGIFNEMAAGVQPQEFVGQFDELGFPFRQGFFTSYFYINIVHQTEAGVCYLNYVLRPNSATFRNFHPCKFMKFAQYGNDNDASRQSFTYRTSHPRPYEAVYTGVTSWVLQSESIIILKGWLGGFSLKMVDGSYRQFADNDHGLYVQKNIYFGEGIKQIDPATYEDIKDEVTNYDISLDIPADTITVDAVGNIIGGLWKEETESEGGVAHQYRKYRLHCAVTVRKGTEVLTILPASSSSSSSSSSDEDDEMEGRYRLYISSQDCVCHLENSTVYIDSIHNTKDGVAGSSDDSVPIDYDAMRAMREVKVTFTIDCEGREVYVRTYTVTVNHIDTAYISADMVNERSVALWSTRLQQWMALPTYQVQLWHNDELISVAGTNKIAISGATLNGQAVNVEILPSAASSLSSGYQVGVVKSLVTKTVGTKTYNIAQIQVAKLASGLADGELRIPTTVEVSYAGVSYERTLDHVMQIASDTNVYSVMPSADQVVVGKDGSLSVSTLTCSVWCDSSDDNHYEVALANLPVHGLALYYQTDTMNAPAPYPSGGVSLVNTMKEVKFILSALSSVSIEHDSESVPFISNGLDAPEMVVTPSVVMVDAKNDGSAYATTLPVTVRMMVGGNTCQLTTSSFSATKPSGVTLGTFSTTNMGTRGQFDVTIAANTAEANYKGNIVFSVEGWYAGKTYMGHGVIAVSASKKGDTGVTGAVIRMRGEFVANNTSSPYLNNGSFIDVVVDHSDGYYYKLKDGVTSYSGATAPSASSSWQRDSNIDFLATKVFITENGYGKVLGAGELWVGTADEGVGVNGWIMKNASIKHNVTGLELTADGYLNDPDGLHMKVGGKNYTNGNMLSNAFFDVLLTEIDDDSQIPEVYLTAEKNGGVHGPHVLAMDIEEPGTVETRLMGGGTPMHGVHLYYQQHTFSIYARRNGYEDYAWVKLYKADNEEMTSNLTLLTTLSIPYSDTFKLLSYSFTPGGANKYFAFKVGMTSEDGGSYLYVDSVKLETGASVTPMCDTSFDDKLLPTGIDIENRKITLTADQLVCQNNSGEKTAWLDSNGNFQTSGIQSSLMQNINSLSRFYDVFIPWCNYVRNGAISVGYTGTFELINIQGIKDGAYTSPSQIPSEYHFYSNSYMLVDYSDNKLAGKSAYNPVATDADMIDPLIHSGSAQHYYVSLDMRAAGGLIEIGIQPTLEVAANTPIQNVDLYITLPFMEVVGISNSVYSLDVVRTPTRMNSEDIHYITVDEIKSLLGRKVVLANRNTTPVHVVNGYVVGGDVEVATIETGYCASYEFVIEQVPHIVGNVTQYYPRYYWKQVGYNTINMETTYATDDNFAEQFDV